MEDLLDEDRVAQVCYRGNEVWVRKDLHQIGRGSRVTEMKADVLLDDDHHGGLRPLVDMCQARCQIGHELGLVLFDLNQAISPEKR